MGGAYPTNKKHPWSSKYKSEKINYSARNDSHCAGTTGDLGKNVHNYNLDAIFLAKIVEIMIMRLCH